MTPEDIKKINLALERYTSALQEAISFSNLLMQQFEKLCNEEECSDQVKK